MNTLPDNARGTASIRAAVDTTITRGRSVGIPRGAAGASAWLLVVATAGAFALSAHAGDSRGDTALVFDCPAMHLPSQQDVTRLLGTHNFHQAYRARERLLQDVRRECLRGLRQVVVKADERPRAAAIAELAESQ